MDTNFWHTRWEKDEIAFHQHNINLHLKTFWQQLAPPQAGGCVFVPLCGKSRDMVWLAQQGYNVLGIELSPVAVQSFFAETELMPYVHQDSTFQIWQADRFTLLCGDFFALDRALLRDVVGVYDRASLIALPPAMREAYAEHLRNVLPTRALLLLVTLEYAEGAMNGPPFSVTETEVRDLYDAHYAIERLYGHDALAENTRFREKGLSYLTEKVYRLQCRTRTAIGNDSPS
jgi:thiopurine S-methyltransferase